MHLEQIQNENSQLSKKSKFMKKMVSAITYTPELNISMLNNILREAEDPQIANLKLLKK